MDLQEYLNRLCRRPPKTFIVNARTHKLAGFVVCKKTKKLGKTGFGYRRSTSDVPIEGRILASFRTLGGGGYVIVRKDNNKIIQVQSFHENKIR